MTNLLGYYVYFQEANVNSHLAHEERHIIWRRYLYLPSHYTALSFSKCVRYEMKMYSP